MYIIYVSFLFRSLIKGVKIFLSTSPEKSVKNSPKQFALKIRWMWRRKYPRRSVCRFRRRSVTQSPELLWRRSRRKLGRRFATAPNILHTATPALPTRRPHMSHTLAMGRPPVRTPAATMHLQLRAMSQLMTTEPLKRQSVTTEHLQLQTMDTNEWWHNGRTEEEDWDRSWGFNSFTCRRYSSSSQTGSHSDNWALGPG